MGSPEQGGQWGGTKQGLCLGLTGFPTDRGESTGSGALDCKHAQASPCPQEGAEEGLEPKWASRTWCSCVMCHVTNRLRSWPLRSRWSSPGFAGLSNVTQNPCHKPSGFFADFYFWAAGFFFPDFVAGFFLLIFVGKSAQKNPPGKSPTKSSKFIQQNPPTHFCRGAGPREKLKGKIVSEIFTLFHYFSRFFHNFSPRTFPFKTKGFSSRRT